VKTLREALAFGRERLKASDSETPELDADVLLRHVLGVDRATLLTHPERAVQPGEVARYKSLVERRVRGEPVAYLTGEREFMGLEFAVDKRVLVPRPDTETLVTRALELTPGDSEGITVVDVGTGSGAIAVSVAFNRPRASVYATDTSPAALEVARKNAHRLLPAGARVQFVHGALLEGAPSALDVICANLPYIPTGRMTSLPVTVRDYEPSAALDGGPDGLDVYRALLPQARDRLKPGGTLLMECDPEQVARLCALTAAAMPGARLEVLRDLAGLDRVVQATRP
jgi:release factor glutamine methyltransferase